MGKVYVRESGSAIWTPMQEDVLSCLEDPLKQGIYYLPRKKGIVLEEIALQHSDQYRLPPSKESKDLVDFASNLGFSMGYSCTSRIISPDGSEAYILIQLSDGYMVDHIKAAGGKARMSLVPNMLKLMDHGHYFIFDGPYEEVSKAIGTRGYKFVEPNEGELWLEWYKRIKKEVLEQRKRLITDEFAKRVNREYFKSPLEPLTRESLIERLTFVEIG